MTETGATQSVNGSTKRKVTIGCAIQKGRNWPPRLTETRTTVRSQHQLHKERPTVDRLSSTVNCSPAPVTNLGPILVSRLPRHPQLLSKSYRGCSGPCSERSSAYRARDPSRKRLHRG